MKYLIFFLLLFPLFSFGQRIFIKDDGENFVINLKGLYVGTWDTTAIGEIKLVFTPTDQAVKNLEEKLYGLQLRRDQLNEIIDKANNELAQQDPLIKEYTLLIGQLQNVKTVPTPSVNPAPTPVPEKKAPAKKKPTTKKKKG